MHAQSPLPPSGSSRRAMASSERMFYLGVIGVLLYVPFASFMYSASFSTHRLSHDAAYLLEIKELKAVLNKTLSAINNQAREIEVLRQLSKPGNSWVREPFDQIRIDDGAEEDERKVEKEGKEEHEEEEEDVGQPQNIESKVASSIAVREVEKVGNDLGIAGMPKNVSKAGDDLPPIDFEKLGKRVKAMAQIHNTPGCFKNDHFKLMYVHLPKNGGTAIVKHLDRIICEVLTNETCKLPATRASGKYLLKKEDCRIDPTFFSFSFSRNPWSRAVSMWQFGLVQRTAGESMENQEQIWSKYCSFKDFISKLGTSKELPNCGFHQDSKQWSTVVDKNQHGKVAFLARLEHFERDLQHVLSRVDASGRLLATHKRVGFSTINSVDNRVKEHGKFSTPREKPGQPYTAFYDQEGMQNHVCRVWSEDCSKLGYSFLTGADPVVER